MKMIGPHRRRKPLNCSHQLIATEYRRERADCYGVWTLVRLHPQDLFQRGAADLELALVRLARAERPLELVARPLERARDRRLRVALRPREDLDRGRRGGERDRAAGQRR